MSSSRWLCFVAAAVLAVLGCGGEDATSFDSLAQLPAAADDGEQGAPAADVVQSEHVKTVREADGSFASQVDATSMQSWVYFNLREQAEVKPEQPEQSASWDLAFQRSNVKLNGGSSGPGGVLVSVASGSFDSVAEAPADGYLADAADADMDGAPDYALGARDGWYSYDPASHVLTARDTVFVLKTAGGYFKLQFSSYYDAAGTPGMPQFRWAPLGGT